MKTIVTLTMNPAIDKASEVENVTADRKLRCSEPRFDPGGGGINVARAVHRLGGEATALYASGGPTGTMLGKLLDEDGINHRPFQTEAWTRENLTVHETSTERQFRFGMPGPHLTEHEYRRVFDELESLVPKPDFLVLSGSLPQGVPNDFYGRITRAAKYSGSAVILDTSGDPLSLALNEGVHLVKPNLRELRSLSDKDLDTDAEQEAFAKELIRSGRSELVVISRGSGGSMIVSKDYTQKVQAPFVPIRSKIGAGDSMVAGTVLSLARGKSFSESVRYGTAAGAAAVTQPGTELCTKEDTDRLYGDME